MELCLAPRWRVPFDCIAFTESVQGTLDKSVAESFEGSLEKSITESFQGSHDKSIAESFKGTLDKSYSESKPFAQSFGKSFQGTHATN